MSDKNKRFEAALAAEGVTGKLAALSRSIFIQESGGGVNTTTSNAGARGGMQVLPGTFAQVADKDWSIDNPDHNARAGIRYLQKMDKLAGGDPALTAAGYYGGPGGLEKARRGISVSDPRNPTAPNTLQYGQQVVARMGGGTPPPAASVAQAAAPGRVPATLPVQIADVLPPQSMDEGEVVLPPQAPMQAQAALQQRPVDATAEQADAWAAFLQAMPKAKGPIQVGDLNFGEMGLVMQPPPQFQAAAAAPRQPNFQAFSNWAAPAPTRPQYSDILRGILPELPGRIA